MSAEDCGKGRYCHIDMQRSTCLQCKALDVVSILISTVNWSPCAIKFYLTTKYFWKRSITVVQCCQWHIRERRFDRWHWVCFFSLFQWGFSLGSPTSSHSPETCMWGKLENQNWAWVPVIICLTVWPCNNLETCAESSPAFTRRRLW